MYAVCSRLCQTTSTKISPTNRFLRLYVKQTAQYKVITVTVTEALVLRSLLKDRGRIIESIRILVPVDRMKQKCFQITTKRVRRSQQFQLRRYSLFHARGAATEKALSPIRRRVVCKTSVLFAGLAVRIVLDQYVGNNTREQNTPNRYKQAAYRIALRRPSSSSF